MSKFNYDEAAVMDKILTLCVNNNDKQFGLTAIKNQVLPDLERTEIIDLFKKIETFDLKVATVNSIRDGEVIMSNENTNSFLKGGGFTEYNNKLKEVEKSKIKDEIIKDLTIKQLKGTIFQIRYWWLILFLSGVIGFVTGNIELILSWL